jgi:hypothetical protein
MAIFWDITPCRLVWVYQLTRSLYCLHHQGDDDSGTETLVDSYQSAERYNPENSHLCTNCLQNLKSYYVSPSLGRGSLLVNSPTELQCLGLMLIFNISASTHVSLILYQNLSCSVFFKCWSVHLNEKFILCLLQNWVYVCGKILCQL